MLPFFPSDIARYLAAIGLFWLVLVPPGFALGWSADLFGFRSKRPLFRLYAATVLGLSLAPILMYLCWSLGSLQVVWVLYGVFWAAFAVLFVLRKVRLEDLRPPRVELCLAAGWVILCALILLDLRIGGGVYIDWASHDHSYRTSVINAIRHTEVLPPGNPFFHPGHSIPFRYHYFWFMLAAFVEAAGAGLIGPRDALFASVAWSGLALVAIVALFLERTESKTAARADSAASGLDEGSFAAWRRQTWIAAGLLTITGLDLIPIALITLAVSLGRGQFFIPYGDFELWNGDGEVASWLGSCIWVPNHVGALVCGCTGVLLLLWAYRSPRRSNRIAGTIAAGIAFASSAGCSIFVVFVFFVALAALLAASAMHRVWRLLTVLVLAGVVAFGAAFPYLHELRAGAAGIQFAVLRPRTFWPVFWFIPGTPRSLDWHGALAMLLCLPLNYALELGFFAAVGVYRFRRLRRASFGVNDRILLFLFIPGLFIASFLASVGGQGNDLGWRAMLIVQFVLLLWAVGWVREVLLPAFSAHGARLRGAPKGVLLMCLMSLAGLAGTIYQASLLRFYAVAIDHGLGADVDKNPELAPGLGARTAELREIYTQALKDLPSSALVQEEPLIPDAVQQGLYATWASADRGREGPRIDPAYGEDPALYAHTEELLSTVFGQPADLAYVSKVCAQTQIGAFVVQDFDAAWREPGSWIWSVPPVYAGSHARAYLCTDILRAASQNPPAQRDNAD